MFDDIDYYLNYYTEFLNSIFKGSKHNEHYKIMKSLTNELNEIKYLISGGER